MEGGRFSHSWCICVVVMAMVGWMGAGMEMVFGKHAGQSQHLLKNLQINGLKLSL